MNTIAANELKRHGIAAIEKMMAKGPVHIIKRNQPVCVVLAEDEYERLLKAANHEGDEGKLSVMEWMALPSLGDHEKAELDDRLSRERAGWDKA